MAKIKLSLTPDPTFKADAFIPVPGKKPVAVEFTFKHRDKDGMNTFFERMKDLDDVALLKEMASGWDLAEPFEDEHIEKMVTKYVGSASAILDVYIAHSTGTANRLKN